MDTTTVSLYFPSSNEPGYSGLSNDGLPCVCQGASPEVPGTYELLVSGPDGDFEVRQGRWSAGREPGTFLCLPWPPVAAAERPAPTLPERLEDRAEAQ
jgi:hypothetical protein